MFISSSPTRLGTRSRAMLVAGTSAVIAASLLVLPHPANAEYQRMPASSPTTWRYQDTWSTLAQARDAAQHDADATTAAASSADSSLTAAKSALADAQAAEQKAIATQNSAKSALDNAKTRDEKAKAQSRYNQTCGDRRAAAAATKKASGDVYKAASALKSAQSAAAKAAVVAGQADTRMSRLEHVYGSSSSTAFTQLRKEYSFTDGQLDKTSWATYDTTKSDNPTARDPKFVAVRNGNLEVSSWGTSGSGVCLCTSTSKSTEPYGSWEVRAKVNRNADHGVAILLWPTERTGPESGEIDLAEFNQDRTQANFALHYDKQNLQVQSHILGDFTQWHTYRVDWNERGVAWYIDNNLFAIVTDPTAIPDTPFQFVLQAGANSSKASKTTTTLAVSSVKEYAP